MKNKNEVYVVVDTPKKAKKLKKVLDMFNEPIYEETNERLSKNEVSEEYPIIYFSSGEWEGYADKSHQHKNEVSIKELKNILAKEHLKEGDYVIATIGKTEYVVKVESIWNNEAFINSYEYLCINDGFKHNVQKHGSFTGFKRYATPEEIALLDSCGGVIKNDDKFAELKEAHKNGAVIQVKLSDRWADAKYPSWKIEKEYRIKPEENPKVGDVVMAWDNESSAYTVGKVIEINSMGYFLQDELWWDNAKTLTQQEVIDLLFKK